MFCWASERLSSQVKRCLDRLVEAEDVQHVAVMPDVHLAQQICVGTAFATTRLIYPQAVGGDIGCGMSTVAVWAERETVGHPPSREEILRCMQRAVPIGRRRRQDAEAGKDRIPDPATLSESRLTALALGDGLMQLGTLGRGNHFLELQADDEGQMWFLVHSGSRAMGQAIASTHLARATPAGAGFRTLDATTGAGQAYLQDVMWARRYASANRRTMLDAVGDALSEAFGWALDDETFFDCDHNHVAAETHFDEPMWVHRKGAINAGENVPGVIPGSMAAPTFHVRGKGAPDALCSAAHGAGRKLSRSEARSRIGRHELVRQLGDVCVDPKMLGALRTEAPGAYKDIRSVMRAMRPLVSTVRTLHPVICHKGG